MQIYKEIITAKNGSLIPLFTSGRSMDSRYNPQRDAENILNTISESAGFFVVTGAGSGIFLDLLSKRFPDSKILCIEIYNEDIEYLQQLPLIKELSDSQRVQFCCLQEIESFLLNNYLPAKHGSLKVIEQKAWLNENQQYLQELNTILKKTLGIISADYSVQTHFAKIWTSNILNNSRLAEKYNSKNYQSIIKSNLNKTAVIIGAGPSLDKTIELVNKDREKYFLIATDTAGQALIKRNITADIIVSIDAQSVSYNHYLSDISKNSKSLFAFDLSSNFSAARHICKSGFDVFFFCSGHPLSTAINLCCHSPLPTYFSGAGTVTITALDLAVKSGFKDILILGADFSYSDGKAYTKGTYLDKLYNKASSKIQEAEESFSRLMFRTELLNINQNKKTTQILEAYKSSLESYLIQNNISFAKADDIYTLKNLSAEYADTNTQEAGSAANFSLKPFFEKIKDAELEEIESILLPYVAWLRNKEEYKDNNYKDLLKLALDSIVSYNR